jgi:hypothetical protein
MSVSICNVPIPERYYKIKRGSQIIAFVGKSEITETLNKLRDQTPLKTSDKKILVGKFGDKYQTVLGLQDGENWDYIEDLIEIDDTIYDLKNKIAVYLEQDIDSIYLYATVKDKLLCLGHTFFEKIGKNDKRLIEYPLDPYALVDLEDPRSMTNKFVSQAGAINVLDREDINDTLISDHQINNNLIYLVTMCDFLNSPKINEAIDQSDLKRFKIGYLYKYWPDVFNNEPEFERLFELCWSGEQPQITVSQDLKDTINKDQILISLIKTPPLDDSTNTIDFSQCSILEMVIHINYQDQSTDFVDLSKIFDRYVLNQEVPFVKYKSDKGKEPIHKLYQPIIEENPVEILQDWVSNIQKKPKSKEVGLDVKEYQLTGRGLSFKKLLYRKEIDEDQYENKYATINFYKDGKIEFKCYWEESIGANITHVQSALELLSEMITKINKIEYQLPGIDRRTTIALPDSLFLQHANSNTQIGYANTVMRVNYGKQIDFNDLNKFVSYFTTYVNVIKHEGEREIDNSVHLKYKRISNYSNIKNIERFIRELTEQTTDQRLIIETLSKHYNLPQEKMKIVYDAYKPRLTKTKKQPGIDVKIQGKGPNYKIFVLGAKNREQLALIHTFLRNMLRLYKDQKMWITTGQYASFFGQTAPEMVLQNDTDDINLEIAKYLSEINKLEEKQQEVLKVVAQSNRAIPQTIKNLKSIAPGEFSVKWSRSCGPHRQPKIITVEQKNQIIDELKEELNAIESQIEELGDDPQLEKVKNSLEDKLEVYRRGIDRKSLTGNTMLHHFCPKYYDQDNQRVLDESEINSVPEGKLITIGDFPHIGFLSTCETCCYKKPDHNVKKCMGDKKGTTLDSLRVLSPDKRFPEGNRYAWLPEVLNMIFSGGAEHKDTNLGSGFKSYLRRGIMQDGINNQFLCAIGDLYQPPKQGNEVRQLLAKQLDEKRFNLMKNGSLKQVFHNGQPFNKFVNYLLDDTPLDEDFVWDYVTAPGVIVNKTQSPKGFNLFILVSSSDNKDSHPFNNITLKCPLGYDLAELYDLERPSVVLFQYEGRYEVICYVTDDGRQPKRLFDPDDKIIAELYRMVSQCTPEIDVELQEKIPFESEASFQFEDPLTVKQTLHQLGSKYQSIGQIIDAYNKTIYLVVTSKSGKQLKIPVKPSNQVTSLPVLDYNQIPALDYYQTIEEMNHVSTETGISVIPIDNLIARDANNVEIVNSVLLKNGLELEVVPIQLDQISQEFFMIRGYSKFRNIQQLYDSRNDVDQSLERFETNDPRVTHIGRRKFEDESYQRIRYELGHLFQDTPDLVDKTTEIIEGSLSINDKRLQLTDLLVNPLKQLVTNDPRDPMVDYDQYFPPNVRVPCSTKTADDCQTDPHCSVTDGQCRLFINQQNLIDPNIDNSERYLALIVEELLKNPLRRGEILNNQVDNFVDEHYLEHRDKEVIVQQKHRESVRQMYKKGVDYRARMDQLYDVANPLHVKDASNVYEWAIEGACFQGYEPLTEHWKEIIGTNFVRRKDKGTKNCILEALTLALNQRDRSTPQTISTIRRALADNIGKLKDDGSQKGWELLLKYYRDTCQEKISEDSDLSDVQAWIRSDDHQIVMMDLIMLSQIYKIKFIILAETRAPLNPQGFVCLRITPTIADSYIVLYDYGLEQYQVVVRMDGNEPKYVFNKKELPDKLYHTWTLSCPNDVKDRPTDPLPVIFSTPILQPPKLELEDIDEMLRMTEPPIQPKATAPKVATSKTVETKVKIVLKPKSSLKIISQEDEEPQTVEPTQLPEPQTVEPTQLPEPQTVEPTHLPEPQTVEPTQLPEPQTVEPTQLPEPQTVEPTQLPEPQTVETTQLPEPQTVEPVSVPKKKIVLRKKIVPKEEVKTKVLMRKGASIPVIVKIK